jgi:hypothetical protein
MQQRLADTVLSALTVGGATEFSAIVGKSRRLLMILNANRIKLVMAPVDAAMQTFAAQYSKSTEEVMSSVMGQDIIENHFSPEFSQDPNVLSLPTINGRSLLVDGNSVATYGIVSAKKVGDVVIYFVSTVILSAEKVQQPPAVKPGIEIDWSRKVTDGNCKRLSNEMRAVILQILKRPDLIYFLSTLGDAVKNTNALRYDHLTPEFKALSYDDKVLAIKNHGLRNSDGIAFRQWPLQQWGKNAMRYAKLTNKHLLYIQSDWNYCAYPSMFAEAIASCGMFTGYKYYPGSGWHFSGEFMDLFCVGDWSIASEIKSLVPARIQIFHGGQREWQNLSDRLLLELYASGQDDPDWMAYPAEVYPRIRQPIRTYDGIVKLINGKNVVFKNARTVADLNAAFYPDHFEGRYIRNGVAINSNMVNLPLTWVLGDTTEDVSFYGSYNASTNPTAGYRLNEDVEFDGTLAAPVAIRGGISYPLI